MFLPDCTALRLNSSSTADRGAPKSFGIKNQSTESAVLPPKLLRPGGEFAGADISRDDVTGILVISLADSAPSK